MTLEELIADVTTKLTRVGSNRISGPEVLQSVLNVISFFATQIASILPEWTNALTFNTDGSGAGKYAIYADTNGKKRIWETKTDSNINHLPPSDPLITENTYWIETSASATSSIQEWAAGLYGPGLVIVAHNHSVDGHGLYWLLEPTRPFASTNIETEITAVKWVRLGGSGTGTGGPAIDGKYANIAAMLADQANQEEDAFYFVLDATADTTVDSGWAIYQKLTASTGAIGDYRKISEEESLDILIGGETVVTMGALIDSATAKATPVDADMIGLMDSAASNIMKKLSWSNIKATLKTYFDSLYEEKIAPAGSTSTAGSSITLDMGSKTQKMFVGSASFASPKTIAMSNTANALLFNFFFEVTNVAAVLTFPGSWISSNTDFDGTDWTPPATGKYELGGSYDGTNWYIKVDGPFA